MMARPLGTRSTWIALLCALTFGCSPLPTAPQLPTPGAAEHSQDSAQGQRVLEPIDPPGGGQGPPPNEPDTLSETKPVEGAQGGRVTVGYVSVDVPGGAWNGQASVEVTVPDSTTLECHLRIYPESMNHFDVPVRLTFDIRQVQDTHNLGIFWFNEEHGRWMQIAGDVDPVNKTITTELSHFSIYKVAKASWTKASW